MTSKNPFADRIHTQAITPEFMREMAGVEEEDEVLDLLERAAERFERSYNAVAAVGERPSGWRGWELHAIPARGADPDSIRRGMQEINYWVSEMGNE